LKNQKFWWRILQRKILIEGYPKVFSKFTCDLCHYVSKVSRYFFFPSFTADRIFVSWINNSFVEQVDDLAMYLSLYGRYPIQIGYILRLFTRGNA
jgi:hypothetical protein